MGGAGGMMLMYDESRRLHRHIMETEQPAAGAIRAVVQRRGYMGLKAYLWARREGADLRLYVDDGDLPQQQQRW